MKARSHPDLAALLTEGDARTKRQSIGRADEVVAILLEKPQLLPSLLECLCHGDPVVIARAANAAEKLSRTLALSFQPYKSLLLSLLAEAQQPELRWQLALIVPRLKLTQPECRRTAAILESYLGDRHSIVKTFAMQGLADLLRQDPARREAVLDLLRLHTRTGTAAMRARGRILLKQLEATASPASSTHLGETTG